MGAQAPTGFGFGHAALDDGARRGGVVRERADSITPTTQGRVEDRGADASQHSFDAA